MRSFFQGRKWCLSGMASSHSPFYQKCSLQHLLQTYMLNLSTCWAYMLNLATSSRTTSLHSTVSYYYWKATWCCWCYTWCPVFCASSCCTFSPQVTEAAEQWVLLWPYSVDTFLSQHPQLHEYYSLLLFRLFLTAMFPSAILSVQQLLVHSLQSFLLFALIHDVLSLVLYTIV